VRASPEHLRAFLEIAAIWGQSAKVEATRGLTVEALLAQATTESNIVDMSTGTVRDPTGSGEVSRFRQSRSSRVGRPLAGKALMIRRFAVAAAVLVVVAGSLAVWSRLSGSGSYTTQVGERRSLRLADGSTMTLNSMSRVRIEFTQTARTVALLQGEALFQVAGNPMRPFAVRSDDTVIRAVGTEFDVKRGKLGTRVTVLEGKVAVIAKAATAASDPAPPVSAAGRRAVPGAVGPDATDLPGESAAVFLSAGEQLNLVAGATAVPERASTTSAMAWIHGRVILESATLEEAAEEFNRYSERRFTAEDHGETPLHLSGVFSTDPGFLLRYLRERPDIRILETTTEIRIIRVGSQRGGSSDPAPYSSREVSQLRTATPGA
jgi:transmembrane sensor